MSAAGARVQQQTSRMPLLLSIDGTDGRKDRRKPMTDCIKKIFFFHRKFGSDTETQQHKHKYKQSYEHMTF